MVHLWLRCETKPGEGRVAITPQDCVTLRDAGVNLTIEKSNGQRIIPDDEYIKLGFQLVAPGSWKDAPRNAVIVGIKELPEDGSPLKHRHIMFGHVFKYQDDWKILMKRFMDGGGKLLDVEFMVDDDGRRVVHEFSPMAGFCGMGVGVHAWCYQKLNPHDSYPSVKAYPNEKLFINEIKTRLSEVAKLQGKSEVKPKVIIIGALGRCGAGAIEMAEKIGFERSSMTLWDLDETKAGGPFKEILSHDIFLNCVYLPSSGPRIPPFLTREMLEDERKLTMVVDVSCDPKSANNPIPIYKSITTMEVPLRHVKLEKSKLPVDVLAIDHLPSVLPRESSERFSKKLTPYLMKVDDQNEKVWRRCLELFESKAKEVESGSKM